MSVENDDLIVKAKQDMAKNLLSWVVENSEQHRGSFEMYVDYESLLRKIGRVGGLDQGYIERVIEDGEEAL